MLACDLHVHIDGSLRESTLAELAVEHGVCPARADGSEFLSGLRFREGMTLAACLGRFEVTVGLLQSRRALRRVADELVRDSYLDGVRHLEVRMCPLLHTRSGLSAEEALEAVVAGIERGTASASGGAGEWLSAGVIVSVLEGSSESQCAYLTDMALAHSGSGVLGLDLAGDEALFDAPRFERHFARAKSGGLGITVHAGEDRDPSHVTDAVEILGADRIGHGVAAASDGEVLDLLAERRTVVECCISSNVHTGAVTSVSEHPLPVFLREGVRAVLATDNRFFSETTLSREYELAGRELSLSREELAMLSVESGRASFLPSGDRESLTTLLHENTDAELGTSKEGDLPT